MSIVRSVVRRCAITASKSRHRDEKTGENYTGVYVLNSTTEFQSWLTQRKTPLGETTAARWHFLMEESGERAGIPATARKVPTAAPLN